MGGRNSRNKDRFVSTGNHTKTQPLTILEAIASTPTGLVAEKPQHSRKPAEGVCVFYVLLYP